MFKTSAKIRLIRVCPRPIAFNLRQIRTFKIKFLFSAIIVRIFIVRVVFLKRKAEVNRFATFAFRSAILICFCLINSIRYIAIIIQK